jgi:hypothetical protein
MKAGIAALASVIFCGNAIAEPTQYVVDGLAVGSQLSFNSASYREYRCSPSEQFAGLTWCQKARNDKERRGSYTAAYSILHSRDGNILYVNRSQEPAFFSPNEVEEEIQRYSRKIGETPRIMKMPHRGGARDGIIAVWGKITLEQLDQVTIRIIADGKSPKKGLLIDFLGNFARSAKEGLAIYRIDGGPGFLWAASYDQKGHGTLRIAAVDASGFLSPPPERQPILPSTADRTEREPERTEVAGTIEILQTKLAIATKTIAELEKARTDAETARIEADKARVDAEIALEQAKVVEKAKLDATIARLKADQPVANAKGSRWENALYGSIGGLLVALTASTIGFLVKRQKAGSSKQQICEPGTSPVETSGQAQSSEARIISPALTPTIAISEVALESELEAQVAAINAAQDETGSQDKS